MRMVTINKHLQDELPENIQWARMEIKPSKFCICICIRPAHTLEVKTSSVLENLSNASVTGTAQNLKESQINNAGS